MNRPLTLVALLACVAADSARADDPPPPPPAGMEVLARGPVHEAFAEPASAAPEPGPVITKQPPAPIEELPPDQRPEGDNVQWVPGYWSWDNDQQDFIWVSGVWRVPPPDRHWIGGHWQQTDKGWTWVAGLWAVANQEELQYLPPPPPTIDQGPSAPAPNEISTYVPGIWVYQQSRYLWRPGFWVGAQPNWIWTPACYNWTPSGCLFVEGYWDRPLDQRGLLFAPIRFGQGWGAQVYTPQYVVNSDFMLGALFVGPAREHYYFGDYFENRYATRGFVAWPDYRVGRTSFDPTYNYYRHQHAADPQWDASLRDLYRARAAGEIARPPQTWGQQVQAVNNITGNKTGNVSVHKNINLTNVQNVTALTSINEIHNTSITNLGSLSQKKDTAAPVRTIKLQSLSKDEHALVQQSAAQMGATSQQRRDLEATMMHQGNVPVKHTDAPKSVKLALPKSESAKLPRTVQTAVPAVPTLPKHEEKPIPTYEPRQPPSPPVKKNATAPAPKKEAAPPAKKEAPPPPAAKKETPPPPPPKKEPPPAAKKETPPPPPPKKEPPPAPKKETPPPPPKKEPPTPKKEGEKTE